MHKPGKVKADPLRGLFETKVEGKPAVVEYDTDSDLRDTIRAETFLGAPAQLEAFSTRSTHSGR